MTAEQEAELLRLQRLKHKQNREDEKAKLDEQNRLRAERMREAKDKDDKERDLWRNKLLAEIKAEEERLARLKKELAERQRKI